MKSLRVEIRPVARFFPIFFTSKWQWLGLRESDSNRVNELMVPLVRQAV